MHKAQRFINHVAIVLDGSSSMAHHKNTVVKVADGLIQDLANLSEEKDQTRVPIYKFHGDAYHKSPKAVECLLFDMDAMRLPSIKDLYTVSGMTALIDAAVKSQEDLATTSQLYGDHGFLSFIVTDGMENASAHSETWLRNMLSKQPAGWHIAWLVPDEKGRRLVRDFGVPDGNIQIWDTTSSQGFVEVGASIKAAATSFMDSRGTGKAWASDGIFGTGADKVNAQTVHSALTPLSGFAEIPITSEMEIRDAVTLAGLQYHRGCAYYQLTKREEIQPQKDLLFEEKATGKIYGGPDARKLVGLPNAHVKVKPDFNPEYTIYVQSTSVNRKLTPYTKVLVRA